VSPKNIVGEFANRINSFAAMFYDKLLAKKERENSLQAFITAVNAKILVA